MEIVDIMLYYNNLICWDFLCRNNCNFLTVDQTEDYQNQKSVFFLIESFFVILLIEIGNLKTGFSGSFDGILPSLLLHYFMKIKILITKIYSKLTKKTT